MKINKISVYAIELPLIKPYWLSGGRLKFEKLDSIFVKIETDEGLTGWAEACPWGHTYLPGFAGGIYASAKLIAPELIGKDPRQIEKINALMDLTLPGHLYAKSPFDIACWDIFAQSASMSIADALGGCYCEPTPIASSVSTDTPERMLDLIQGFRDKGYFLHSVKIGADTQLDILRIRYLEEHRLSNETIFYDINRAWLPSQAITVMNQVNDLPVIFEQPCETLQQCKVVREKTRHPISIDERLETLSDMQTIVNEKIGEIINIKISRVGGLTRARKIRDIAMHGGYEFLIMDTGGSVISDTATQHFAQTIPIESRMGTWLCQEMITVDTAPHCGSRNHQGSSEIPKDCIGLGVAPDESILGKPIAIYQ